MKRTYIFLTILLLITSFLMGCWNRREIENLNFVMGAGIDLADKKGLYKLTVQVAKPEAMIAKGGGSQQKAYIVYSGEGRTFFEAARNITHQSSARLFWSHNLIYIIGEEAARKGIKPLLDFVERDAELRRTFWILISKGRAEKLLRQDPKAESSPAMEINDMIKTVARGTSTSKMDNINDLMQTLTNRYMASTTGVITTTTSDGKPAIYITGAAAFKGDKLKKFLTSKQTRGLLWVLGEVKSTLIVIDSPITGKKIAIEVIKSKSDVKTSFVNGKPKINASIAIESNIGEQFDEQNYLRPNLFKLLENEANKTVKQEILETLKVTQKARLDVFGFSRNLHIQHKNDWHKIQHDWDKIYPTIPVTVKVETSIRRPGVIISSVDNPD